MSRYLIIILVWIGFVLVNILIAKLNSDTVQARIDAKDTRQINHPLWAGAYALLCVPAYIFFREWYFIGSIILLHLSVFPVLFNIFRGNPAFYLSKTTTAVTDQFMVSLGLKSTEAVNILAVSASIFLLFLTLNK
jgi:hypothetical protein